LPRYRFADFTLSPRRRTLVRGGRELPLIPRYFDLLVFLVEHRHEAVERRLIFEHVWSEVIVCDSALSQAVRTLRRTLEDDSREPRFIRTVARHGYQFIYPDVVVDEENGGASADVIAAARPTAAADANADSFEPLLQRLIATPASEIEEEDQREAAELLHAHGTAEALRRLGTRNGHVRARALLRDTRWDVPGAGDVPIVGQPNAAAVAIALVVVRLRRAARAAAARWLSAAIGAGLAGAAAGVTGGVLLSVAPGSTAPLHGAGVLGLVGACVGALAGAGVGAGLTFGEATARSNRVAAVIVSGALGGGCAGFIAQWLGRWTLDTLVGISVDVGGGIEGLLIGALSGLGYALTTRRAEGGLAAPRGRRLAQVVAATGGASAAGGVALALAGRPLVGGTIHAIALASSGSHALLTPLGRLLGEPDFGPVTRIVIAAGETGLFGIGLALGLTRSPKSHDSLTSR
jgi:DNA-binding winged helix-turn-helix (wHTH) protein